MFAHPFPQGVVDGARKNLFIITRPGGSLEKLDEHHPPDDANDVGNIRNGAALLVRRRRREGGKDAERKVNYLS